MPILVEQYARESLREVDISGKIGINVLTLSEYKNRYPGIQEALEVAKSIIDHQVENKLLEAALSFSYEERRLSPKRTGMSGRRSDQTCSPKHYHTNILAEESAA